MLWVLVRGDSIECPQHICLWRTYKNYPSVIIKHPPYLFFWRNSLARAFTVCYSFSKGPVQAALSDNSEQSNLGLHCFPKSECLKNWDHYCIHVLTHICQVDPSILINWKSPFRILGVSDVLLHFYSISNRNPCKQTVKTLMRRRVLRRLIWVCTVCLWRSAYIG